MTLDTDGAAGSRPVAPPSPPWVLRANPAYDLVPLDRLDAATAAAVVDQAEGGFGALVPRETTRTAKAVDEATALLLYTLAEPGPLPAHARARLGAAAPRAVARLVLDGVLEVLTPDGFRCGPAAHAVFFPASPSAAVAGRDSLSVEALRQAAALGVRDPVLLARHLYLHHRAPLTPAWQARLPGPAAVLDHLRARSDGGHGWGPPHDSGGWLVWTPARQDAAPITDRVYKLYLSPTAEVMPDAFAAWMDVSPGHPVMSFKTGRDAASLLRPDKFVAYFRDLETLAATAAALAPALAGLPAHGVPFTAQATADGLLGWGIDPPAAALGWWGRESWRSWLTRRLGEALADALRAPGGPAPEAWRYALDRVRLDGVDTDTWRPRDTVWQDYLQGAGR